MATPMSTKKHKVRLILAGSLGALLMAAMCSWADVPDIEIQVAPNVLNISNQGEVVTVHTDIAFSLVVHSSVSLNGVKIDHWKADNRGNFVAKFLMDEIKALAGTEEPMLAIGEFNTLTMTGYGIDGEEFSGSTKIMVINNVPNIPKK